MRILHLVHQYLPEHVGGTELYTQWLSQALRHRGHDVSIFYRRSAAGQGLEGRTEEKLQIWAAWAGVSSPTRRFVAGFSDPPLSRAFEQVLAKTRPDIVHVQHLMGQPAALIQAIERRSIPYVITLHDFWWVCANAQLLTNDSQELCDGPQFYLNCARCALARAGQPGLWPLIPVIAGPLFGRNQLLKRIMQGAKRLIAPSEFVRSWYATHGVAAEQLVTIPHGLPLTPFNSKPARPGGKPLRFAYIGGLSWQKGVHIVIEAFKELAGSAELWIAGDETADPGYVADLRAQSSPHVCFLGALTREEVWRTLAQVDVVVMPSLWYEAFAFVISEAFAAGVPVVASRLGPLVDRVRHEESGLLVPPGDVDAWRKALRRFQQEPDLLPRLRQGIQPVRTIDDHVKDIEALYRDVIDSTHN